MSGVAPDVEALRQQMATYSWYHTIELGHGLVTPGQFDHRPLLEHYGIPESLEGKTVLDVGPGQGFFAFECERRGAARVATAELASWGEHDASPALRDLFERERLDAQNKPYLHDSIAFAIEARGSRVERRFCNVYDIGPQTTGVFDLVFCGSLLLHLTDPLRALFAIRTATREVAIVSTGIDTNPSWGRATALFCGTELGQAFWLPNMRCLEAMARAAGFKRVERVSTFSLKSLDGQFDTPHGTIRAFVA